MYLASITCPELVTPDCLVPAALPLGPDGASAPFSSGNVCVRSMLGTFCRRDDMASGVKPGSSSPMQDVGPGAGCDMASGVKPGSSYPEKRRGLQCGRRYGLGGKTWIIVSDASRGPRSRVRYGLGGKTWIIVPGKRRGLQCGRRYGLGGKTWIIVSGIIIYLSSVSCLVPGAAPSHGDAGSGLAREGTGLVWKHPSSRYPCTSYVSIICVVRLAPHSPQLGGDEYLSRIYRVRSSEYHPGSSYWVGDMGRGRHPQQSQHCAIPPCGHNTRSAATSR
jgi:hypothetical protein